MPDASYITTSWDDGHPFDLRVAELLTKYRLPGTFYVPRSCETEVMKPSAVRELAGAFEIGAHTLNHTILAHTTAANAAREISGSKAWVEDLTGSPCRSFCPPQGRFRREHISLAENAGFRTMRTTELLSLRPPQRFGRLFLMPTTIQAQQHDIWLYARNLLKRAAVGNAWQFMKIGASTDWLTLSQRCLDVVAKHGGVFHLWGHSWELQEEAQWRRLESVLELLGDAAKAGAKPACNGELCDLL
jgi:peptidoglycan-N-acetylglucosamine deacetylase